MNKNNLPEGFELVEETQNVIDPNVPDGFEIVEDEKDEKIEEEAKAVTPTPLSAEKSSKNNEQVVEKIEIDTPTEEVEEEVIAPVATPVKLGTKPVVTLDQATTTKEVEKAFKDQFGFKMNQKAIDKAIEADMSRIETDLQNRIQSELGGIEQFKKIDPTTKKVYYDLDQDQRAKYKSIIDQYNKDLEKVKGDYSNVGEFAERYNQLAKEEHHNFLTEFEKQKKYAMDITGEQYLRYDRQGNLVGIHNYDSIAQTYVDSPSYTFDKWKEITYPTGTQMPSKKVLKQQYKDSIYSQPKFDSVEEYIEAYNKHPKLYGRIVPAGQMNLLAEFEVVADDPNKGKTFRDFYAKDDNRRKYWNNTIGTETMLPIFTSYGEDEASAALAAALGPNYSVEPATMFFDELLITAPNGETTTVKIDYEYEGDKEKALQSQKELVDFLALNSNYNDIQSATDSQEAVKDELREAEKLRADQGGLNVEHLRGEKLKSYAIQQRDQFGNIVDEGRINTKDFTVDLKQFANKTKTSIGPQGNLMRTSDSLDDSSQRRAQQTAFNNYIHSLGGQEGIMDYVTMPTYTYHSMGTPTEKNKKPGTTETKNAKILSDVNFNRISKYSVENGEALFYYTDKSGESKLFDTEKWSEENGGKNFTEFITRKAIVENIVPEELVEEKKRAFENYIQEGGSIVNDRLWGKTIMANLSIENDLKLEISATNFALEDQSNKLNNITTYYSQAMNGIMNDPTYNINIVAGEDLVEIPTNYGENVVVPKRIVDGSIIESAKFTATSTNINKLFTDQLSLLDEIKDVNEQWEVYKLNYSDAESAGQNFLLSTADLVANLGYGAYKYLSPQGWIMSALKYSGQINEDPVTEAMLAWRKWGNYKRSLYNAPTEFGKFESAGDFGSWFFNMAGSQIPQYAVFALSGGTAYLPLVLMGVSATGASDLDYREQVIRGERDYSEAGVMWRALLSGGSETVFASLPTWKIMSKGKSLVSGLGGNAESQFFKNGYQYFRKQVPGMIKENALDTGGELVNNVVQNVLAGNPYTQGMGEVAATTLLMSGPISIASPTYYAITSKDFIGGEYKQNISDASWRKSQLLKENSLLNEQRIQIFSPTLGKEIDVNTPEFIQNKQTLENINKKLHQNEQLMKELDADMKESYDAIDALIEQKGIDPAANKSYQLMLSQMSALKNEAKAIKSDNTLSEKQKVQKLDELNSQYLHIKQNADEFLNPKYYGNAWSVLKGSSVFNRDNRQKVRDYRNKAKAELGENVSEKDIDNKAKELYGIDLALEQLAKDYAVNPNLEIAYTEQEAIDLVNAQTDLSEDQKKQLKQNIKDKVQNGFFIEREGATKKSYVAIVPNMAYNEMFSTGTHENSHDPSAILIKENPEKFKAFSDQLVSYLETTDPSLLLSMVVKNNNLKNDDGTYDPEEVIAAFLENVGDNKITLPKRGGLVNTLGVMLNQALSNSTDGEYTINFRGSDDIITSS